MSTQTITIKTCEGCQKSDYYNGLVFPDKKEAVINQSKMLNQETRTFLIETDLCLSCDEVGLFICAPCRKIHRHETDCPTLSARLPETAELVNAVSVLENSNFAPLRS